MSGLKKLPSEGGSGGKRGHSAMEHSVFTAEIKDAARIRRRIGDREAVKEGLAESSGRRRITGRFSRRRSRVAVKHRVVDAAAERRIR
jgi:hypothetical protein